MAKNPRWDWIFNPRCNDGAHPHLGTFQVGGKPNKCRLGRCYHEVSNPTLNYATFLLGLYLTVVWAIDGDSIIASTMATLVVLILMFLTGRFFSKSTSLYLPGALEVMDDKADLGLSGGSTIIVGIAKGFIWGSAILLILAHL